MLSVSDGGNRMYRDETIERATPGAVEAAPAVATVAPTAEDGGWRAEVVEHLRQAADIAGQHGGFLDAFVEAAYGIYLERNPAVRERLEAAHLAAQLDDMRQRGRVGSA